MKKNILLIALVAGVMVTCTILMSDGLTYMIASLMALTAIGVIRANKSRVMKITRWAKANPKKAQWLIAGLLFALMGLGIMAGNNLKELGYLFSNTTAYVFSAIMIIGFLSVPFRSKPGTIAIPKELNRQRLAYLGITLSSFIMMALVGNRIGDIYPNSPITHSIETIDQFIFSDDITPYLGQNEATMGQVHNKNYRSGFAVFVVAPAQGIETIDQPILSGHVKKHKELNEASKAKKDFHKAKKDIRHKLRQAATGGSCALAVLLIILLAITTCAGVCLLIGGVAAIVSGDLIGIVGILLGPLIVWGSILGIRSVSKWCKRINE